MRAMRRYFPEGRFIDKEKNQQYLASPAAVAEAAARGEILEAKATVCDAQHNLMVDLGCMRGYILRNDGAVGIDSGKVRDIALISRVGKPVCFVVNDVKLDAQGKPYALLSRRKAQELCRREYIARLRPGDIIDARVTHLENFGAFCDVGCGIVALMPIDAISISRIAHPRGRFQVGDDIRAVVRCIDDQGRITLSHKELLGTWEENAAEFQQGETVTGIIRSVEDYGVFVELTPNLAGLAEPHAGVFIGQRASVYIKSLLPEKMKVKLIIIDTFDSDYTCPIQYFIHGDHISHWRYSPDPCCRLIESCFS